MSLWKASLIITLLRLMGRISGYGRDFTISILSGANNDTDIAFLILTLPDLVINIILAGGLNTTIIPKLENLNDKDKKIISGQILMITVILFIVISVIISFNAENVIKFLAPGIKNISYFNNILPIITIIFILPICAFNGILNSVLNSKNIFYPGAISSTILNISMIIFSILGFLILKVSIIWALIFGFIFGVISRFILQLRIGYKFFKTFSLVDRFLFNLDFLKVFVGNLGFSTALTILPIISRSFASKFDSGSITLFTYSHKILVLPLAVIMGSFTTVLLPYISKKENLNQINKVIRRVFYLSLSLSIIAFIISPTFISLTFKYTSLNDNQLNILKEITATGFLFLTPMSINSIYGIKYAAERNTLPLFLCGFIMVSSLLIISPHLSQIWALNGVISSYGISHLLGAFFMFIWDNNLINLKKIKNL